jgi:hypothetical protein
MRSLKIVALCIAFFVAGCEPRTPSADYDLTPDQIKTHEAKAAAGDAASANSLAMYYDSWGDNESKYRIWSVKAAELGDHLFLSVAYQDDYREYHEKKKRNELDCELLLRGYRFASRYYLVDAFASTKKDIDAMRVEIAKSGCNNGQSG